MLRALAIVDAKSERQEWTVRKTCGTRLPGVGGLRVIAACFAHAPYGWLSHRYMPFLLTLQEVGASGKTRNQFIVSKSKEMVDLTGHCAPSSGSLAYGPPSSSTYAPTKESLC